MADPATRRKENVPGRWFVDDSCIDCGTCMWMAPQVFEGRGGKAAVHRQPDTRSEQDASLAAVACPTGSIGGVRDLAVAVAHYPRPIAPDVWHLGFHDRKTYGATPYLVQTRKGNVMVDVPRYGRALAERIEAAGGLKGIVITHKDDVGDHEKWHNHFRVPRAMHVEDANFSPEKRLKGAKGKVFGLRWTHVPGHTEGSIVLQHKRTVFTGDHLAGDPVGALRFFEDACWFDLEIQRQSLALMASWDVEHVLPAHGMPWRGSVAAYQAAMAKLVA